MRSLLSISSAQVRIQCGARNERPASVLSRPPAVTEVRGRFSWAAKGLVVRGRFAKGGRRAVGTVSVARRGTGCTPVTRLAAGWRLLSGCRGADGLPRTCVVAGQRCRPVAKGRLRDLAGVRCGAPSSS